MSLPIVTVIVTVFTAASAMSRHELPNTPTKSTEKIRSPLMRSASSQMIIAQPPKTIIAEEVSAGAKRKAADKLNVVYGLVGTTQAGKFAQQLRAVEETWAKNVPPQKLLVVGATGSAPEVTYSPAPLCQDLWTHWQPGLACKEATIIANAYQDGADWAVVGYPDNYVFPRLYEAALAKYDSAKPQILGGYGCGKGYCKDHEVGLCGGGTYAVSRGAMEAMVGTHQKTYIQEVNDAANIVCGNWSDIAISCVARRNHVKVVVPTHIDGLNGNRVEDKDIERQILSHTGLAFHYVTTQKMHQIHKMGQTLGQNFHETQPDIHKMVIDGAKGKPVSFL